MVTSGLTTGMDFAEIVYGGTEMKLTKEQIEACRKELYAGRLVTLDADTGLHPLQLNVIQLS